jgi:hypothetical protein
MRTRTAARIVSECIDYTNKYGSFPEAANKRERRNIKSAFKITYYTPGDFSFIKNDFKRTALEHDYKVITRLNAWNDIRKNCEIVSDPVYFYMYYYHTNKTRKLSLKALQYISIHGWVEYVLQEMKKM